MQFSAIRTYCALRFRDTANTIVTDTDWKSYVNSAYSNLLSMMPNAAWNEFSGTVTIAANGRSGSLPSEGWRVMAVYDATDGWPLVPLEGRDQVYDEYPQQTETGPPQHYRIFNNTVMVYPLPTVSTALTVEYAKLSGDLVADGDIPVVPAAYHDLIVAGAVEMAYRDDGNLQMATQYQAEFDQGAQILKTEAGQPRQSRFYEIVDNAY